MPASKIRDALLGLAVGDAMGVPHELRPRWELDRDPVVGMTGGGSWNQPPGTWSDDSALSFCLAESLCRGYDLRDIADRFVAWRDEGYWSARGAAFGVGRTVEAALDVLRSRDRPPAAAGRRREVDNGNGSLMRILPAAFAVRGRTIEDRAWIVAELSSLTHGHRRAQLACIAYVETALRILEGDDLRGAWRTAGRSFFERFGGEPEASKFVGVFSSGLPGLARQDVVSSAYVVDTLEAVFWCLLTTSGYREAVLSAVNLGGDSDTVAALAGGLGGLAYGTGAIPSEWLEALARKDDIEDLAARLEGALRAR